MIETSAQGESKMADASKSSGFSAEEKAAMKEAAAERRLQAKRAKELGAAAADLADVFEKIAAMPEPDRSIATKVHEIVLAACPELAPKTWYGMPAYALNGKTICFFQSASKFKYRYCTLGFQEAANIDEGHFWPVAFAVVSIDKATEKRITELVKLSVS
jgi:uncharacterized protein YdhG (YjbR/CyaY superfamily)